MRFIHPWLNSLLLTAWLGVSSVCAQSADSEFSEPKEIEKRLNAARAELAAISSDANPRLSDSLQRIVASTEYHLSSIEVLAAMRDQLAQAREESSSWSDFPSPPPYSVRMLDEVREALATHQNYQNICEAQIRIYKREIESLGELRANHLQSERRFLEAMDTRESTELKAEDSRSAKIESLQARMVAERIGRRQIQVSTLQAELAATTAHKELAERKLEKLGDQIVFTQQELDQILEQLARDHDHAAHALTNESAIQRTPDPLLSWRVEFVDLQKQFWQSRFIAMNRSPGAESRDALATLESLRERVDDWIKIADLRLAGGSSEVSEVDLAKYRDSLLELRTMQRQIAFAIGDLKKFNLLNRGTPLINRAFDACVTLWNTELYLVEEHNIVDGKKIPVYRAITVGKVLRLTMILLVGWLLLRWLSRRIKATLTKRKTIAPATAETMGKVAFAFGLCLLVLYALNAVRIPLTAFAFLGGALAIGVGFGTQTILKNFISGIIILFERPLKVGDVVETSNITGKIQKIGMRASIIRHFDGIETLVPNSFLLENQLTNWTLSNSVIRHEIIIGVAYGSPTRDVSRTLLAVTSSHGLVKEDPPPEVRFDDFGADSLTFSLLFWFDVSSTVPAQLASDLRHMIDKAFAEAGIVIAFPQRDIHFDKNVPLRVEIARKTATSPNKETKSES